MPSQGGGGGGDLGHYKVGIRARALGLTWELLVMGYHYGERIRVGKMVDFN